jgi:hypothetical protein
MVKFDEFMTNQRIDIKEYSWQVIFMTAEGVDYCRETKPGDMTPMAIFKWAEGVTETHEFAKHARIERF